MGDVEAEIELVRQLGLEELRVRWMEIKGNAPSRFMSPQLLRLALAYDLQEEALGGLSSATKLRLRTMEAGAGSAHSSVGKAKIRDSRKSARSLIKPGTKFLREWQGKTHEVQLLEDGKFVHDGKAYRSLTTIARVITGAHQSGPRFFGLREADHHGQ